MARTRRARLGFGLCLSLAVLVGMALVAELGLRVAGYDPLGGGLEGRELLVRESDHPDLVYELTPGASGSWGGVEVVVNSHGFRDREVAAAAPPGTRRVAVLGDSITMGWAFPVEETFPKRAEILLQGSDPPIEVLNLGVAGYGSLDEVAFFEKVGRPLEPDLVVLAFCVNDLGESSLPLDYIRRLQRHGTLVSLSRLYQWFLVNIERVSLRGAAERSAREAHQETLEEVRPGGPLPENDPLLERMSRLREALAEVDERLAASGEHNARQQLFDWYQSPKRLAGLRRAFERLAQLQAEDGFDLALLFVPYLDRGRHGTLVRPNRIRFEMVAQEARRVGFDVIHPSAEFQKAGLARLRRRGDPIHPNPKGHAILADALATYLRDWTER